MTEVSMVSCYAKAKYILFKALPNAPMLQVGQGY